MRAKSPRVHRSSFRVLRSDVRSAGWPRSPRDRTLPTAGSPTASKSGLQRDPASRHGTKHFRDPRFRGRSACFADHYSSIRAVLVETTSETRARKLMELAQHPAVVGASKRSGLYWFTISPRFAGPASGESANRALLSYLDRPKMVLNAIWALSDRSLHALGNSENSAHILDA
jgi:hypothetical protein